MLELKSKNALFTTLVLSFIFHLALSFVFIENLSPVDFNSSVSKNHSFKVQNIKTKSSLDELKFYGAKDGADHKYIAIPKKNALKKVSATSSQLPTFTKNPYAGATKLKKQNNKSNTASRKKSLVKSIQVKDKQIKSFLKSKSPNYIPPHSVLSMMDDYNYNVRMELPKGVPEDELNQRELVFYSFQKRTVMAYINSVHQEMNTHQKKNPHLNFPYTKESQQMIGRVVYDKNGDIVRIETKKWSDVKKLQDFFMNVLKNMSSLPNPPKEMLNNEQFAINFVLNIKA